jgi:hypothetical protein
VVFSAVVAVEALFTPVVLIEDAPFEREVAVLKGVDGEALLTAVELVKVLVVRVTERDATEGDVAGFKAVDGEDADRLI